MEDNGEKNGDINDEIETSRWKEQRVNKEM